MQAPSRTEFENVPLEMQKQIDKIEPRYRTPEAVKAIIQNAPRPTLVVGEVVRFNDMNFKVLRIKADGKVGLKMVP